MFENPRRGRLARNFAKIVPKILDLKSSSEQDIFRKLTLDAPDLRGITGMIYSIQKRPSNRAYLNKLSVTEIPSIY